MSRASNSIAFFVHPLPAAAVIALFINDHFLKRWFGTWWTGKLSDFAGLFFFPLFVLGCYVALGNILKRDWRLTERNLVTAIVMTDLLFAAIKLFPDAAMTYVNVLSYLGFPSRVILDSTDLLAISVSPLTYWHARRYCSSNKIVQAKLPLSKHE